jgi:hypothetical protein
VIEQMLEDQDSLDDWGDFQYAIRKINRKLLKKKLGAKGGTRTPTVLPARS